MYRIMAERCTILVIHLLFCFTVCSLVMCTHVYEGQCPDGWVYFRGSCYMFADNMTLNWTEAVHHCSLYQAHLVKIDNKAEDLFLQDMAKRLFRGACLNRTLADSFHTGASDAVKEGIWTWHTDNSDLVYTNWAHGQPETNSGRDQDCLVLTSTDHYRWHDTECSRICHPLCETD